MKWLFIDQNFGARHYVIGSWRQRFTKAKAYLQSFIQKNHEVEIIRNEPFYIPGAPNRQKK